MWKGRYMEEGGGNMGGMEGVTWRGYIYGRGMEGAIWKRMIWKSNEGAIWKRNGGGDMEEEWKGRYQRGMERAIWK